MIVTTMGPYIATSFRIDEIGTALEEVADGKKDRSGYMRLNEYRRSRRGDFAMVGNRLRVTNRTQEIEAGLLHLARRSSITCIQAVSLWHGVVGGRARRKTLGHDTRSRGSFGTLM